MTKFKIITPPDIVYEDCLNLLLINPTQTLLQNLQTEVLGNFPQDMNIYLYEKNCYIKEDIDWLLKVFYFCNIVIVDIDNTPNDNKLLLSYFIAKTKTYWLTNAVDCVYNHLSSNRIYNLSFLTNLGGTIEKEQ